MSVMSTSSQKGCSFLWKTPSRIFIPEDFTSNEQFMIQTADAFVRKEILPVLDRLDQQEEGLMQKLIKKAGELGFCGVDAPEAYGGIELSKNLASRILEFLSLNGSFSVTIGVTSGVAQLGLTLFGTESLKKKYLPGLISGKEIGAYALSEPNSGSDALSLSTTADQKGDHYVLNGTKMWITNAKWASIFTVFAKTSGQNISAFIVERNTPGLIIEREEHKMGLKGSSTARIVLDNVRVPEKNLLYQQDKGHIVAFNVLNLGRLKLSAMSLGSAKEAIAQADLYAKERSQFGQTIAEFPMIKRKFTLARALYFAAESMIYRTGAAIDQIFSELDESKNSIPETLEAFAVESSICKVFSTEIQNLIIDEMLQVLGGYGFSEEFPLARLYRDCRVSRIYEGTNEINRLFITKRILQQIGKKGAGLITSGDSFISELIGNAYPKLSSDQIFYSAFADLLILNYAEQSARIRADQTEEIEKKLYATFCMWANIRAAEAYQALTGASVNLPGYI